MKTITRLKTRVRPLGDINAGVFKRSPNLLELIKTADSFCSSHGFTYLEPIYKCIEIPDIVKDNTNSTIIDRRRKTDSRKHKDKEVIYYEAHLIKTS